MPHPSQESGINLVLLAMAADIPHERGSAELMAQYAEELAGNGEKAEALDWFARILEGGEPELAPHAALRMGQLAIDEDVMAALAALRYAVDNGETEVAACARQNLETMERRGAGIRPEPAPVQEVLGRGALARGLLWFQAGETSAAVDSFQDAVGCPLPDISVPALSMLGECLLSQGNIAGMDALEQAVAAGHPEYSPLAETTLAEYLAGQAQLGGLDHAQETASGIDMNDPAVIGAGTLAAGQEFLERGDLQSAIHMFEKAMDTGHPLHAPKGAARVGLAFSLMEADGARIAIGRLTEVGHGHLVPRAWFCFGTLMLRAGKLADAGAAFRHASGSDAHAAALCVLWMMRGDAARSQTRFRDVLSTTPDLASEVIEAALDLGDHQVRTGDRGTARGTFDLGCRLAEMSDQPHLIAQARAAQARQSRHGGGDSR